MMNKSHEKDGIFPLNCFFFLSHLVSFDLI